MMMKKHEIIKLLRESEFLRRKVERFYEDLQYLLELTPKKDVLFITGDWNGRVMSSFKRTYASMLWLPGLL